MADKLETITLQFQKRVAAERGPIKSEDYNDNFNEVSHDFIEIVTQWNNRLVPLTTTLPNESGSDSLDAFDRGLDGHSIYANKNASASNLSSYYNSTQSRPNSIYEQLVDVYSDISDLQTDIATLENEVDNFTPTAANVTVVDTAALYSASNVETALAEVMTAVNNVSAGALDLSAVAQHYIPAADNTYNIGSSARRLDSIYVGPSSFHVVSKTTDTANAVDRTYNIQVNTAAGSHTGKLEIESGGQVITRFDSVTGEASFPNGIALALNGLSDTDVAAATNGQVLTYNNITGNWEPETVASTSLNGLSDVTIAGPSTGEVVQYNGVGWVNSTITISEISDINPAGASSGDVLEYNGASWVAATRVWSDASDVNTSGATENQTIRYVGGSWVPADMVSGVNDLLDVTITSASTGEHLRYNGSAWVNATPLLSDSSDIDTSGVTDGQILIYNSGTGDWLPGDVPSTVSGLEDLHNIDLTGLVNDNILIYNSSTGNFEPGINCPTVSSLDIVSDVDVSTVVSGEYLSYDGVNWINVSAPISWTGTATSNLNMAGYNIYDNSGDLVLNDNTVVSGTLDVSGTATFGDVSFTGSITGISLDEIADVDTTTVASGEYLKYDGSNWVNSTVSAGSTTLVALTDTNINSPTNGQVLKYDNGSSKWINAADTDTNTWIGTATSDLDMAGYDILDSSGDLVINDNLVVSGNIDISSNDINNVNAIQFNLNPTHSHSEGSIHWDDNDKTLNIDTDISDTAIQVGQEIVVRCYNNSSVTINNGEVVYVSGATTNRPTIAKADASAFVSSDTVIGLATHQIDNGNNGYVTTFGLVRDINTSSFAEGAQLYVSATTPGALTDTMPEAPDYIVKIGFVITSHASTGKVLVNVNHTGNNLDYNFNTNGNYIYSETGVVLFNDDVTISGNLNISGSSTGLDHTDLSSIGTNTHSQIDTHISNTTIHFTEGSIDHGSIAGLTDIADHPGYLTLDGSRTMVGNLDLGNYPIYSSTADVVINDGCTISGNLDITGSITAGSGIPASLNDLTETAVTSFTFDTGTTNLDTFADTAGDAAHWQFVFKKSAALKTGLVISTWDATGDTVSYTEQSTEVGDVSDVSLSVDIDSNTVRLKAVSTSDGWSGKVIRTLM